ncbi:phytanoyl-CoA dioxygenase family protein [Moorena sp. SIO3I6]|uniref:phytanoyl-CoA dioxygenase family protein n=1 Tax=Moorena sp. SIO3I6 TaxID=2607831 RepID=UPI0013FA455D|nr:phytanoyl-CoA dioxygenase family protein [Moorena sp. SIO3I6]NEP24983.1 ectoine hydroxylase [Moorena sp. SIO3I6]
MKVEVEQDLYPSRGDKSGFIKRKEQIIYGTIEQFKKAQLDNKEVTFYKKNGYLIIEKMLYFHELNNLKNEAEKLKKNYLEESENPEIIREIDSKIVRSVYNIHKTNEIFKKLCYSRKILNIAEALLGSPTYIHQSRMNCKDRFDGKGFYWHSDFETWHSEDGMPNMRAVSCSILLTDNNEFNGPLLLVPGSHKYFIQCPGKTPEAHYKHSLKKQEYGVPTKDSITKIIKKHGITSFKAKAGWVIFFDCNIIHGSSDNLSPFPRYNLFFVYNSIYNKLISPYAGTKPRPEFIASREH